MQRANEVHLRPGPRIYAGAEAQRRPRGAQCACAGPGPRVRLRGVAGRRQSSKGAGLRAAAGAAGRGASVRHAGDGAVRPALGHRQRRLGLPGGLRAVAASAVVRARARAGRGRGGCRLPRARVPGPPPPPWDLGATALPVYRRAGRAQGHGAGPPARRRRCGAQAPRLEPPGRAGRRGGGRGISSPGAGRCRLQLSSALHGNARHPVFAGREVGNSTLRARFLNRARLNPRTAGDWHLLSSLWNRAPEVCPQRV